MPTEDSKKEEEEVSLAYVIAREALFCWACVSVGAVIGTVLAKLTDRW